MIFTFNLRLMPLLMLVAAVAFGFKMVNLYTGLDMLSEPAYAAPEDGETEEADDEGQSDEDAGEGEASDASDTAAGEGVIDTSVILGLPSEEQMQLLTSLRARNEALDRREKLLDLRDQTLAATEQRIERKIAALDELEKQIRGHLRIFDEEEAKQLDAIVQVYQTMKPKDAAPRFEALALDVQIDLATRMSNRKFADILSKMNPRKATELTTELATKAQPPTLQDIQTGSR